MTSVDKIDITARARDGWTFPERWRVSAWTTPSSSVFVSVTDAHDREWGHAVTQEGTVAFGRLTADYPFGPLVTRALNAAREALVRHKHTAPEISEKDHPSWQVGDKTEVIAAVPTLDGMSTTLYLNGYVTEVHTDDWDHVYCVQVALDPIFVGAHLRASIPLKALRKVQRP